MPPISWVMTEMGFPQGMAVPSLGPSRYGSSPAASGMLNGCCPVLSKGCGWSAFGGASSTWRPNSASDNQLFASEGWKLVPESAGFEQCSGGVAREAPEPWNRAAQMLEPPVNGLGGSVGHVWSIREGEDIDCALLQGTAVCVARQAGLVRHV